MEGNNTSTNTIKDQTKIKTLQCYTKIQEGRPAHLSNLINKQFGYDAILEMGENQPQIKIKNCVCSARSNSELFKRFSRSLISNLKNNIDQLFFFVSASQSTRLQTSIGLSTNPGLFLIVGLTFLDQKYKQAYQKCDVQFSFTEFRQGQMYDLLCYTGQPLTAKRECSTNKLANFGQHWTRTTTFNQFIKLFKIALFNNKERDFSLGGNVEKLKSTFIMKVRSKLYSDDGELMRENQTALIDFEPNCVKESLQGSKEKNGSKNFLDYILIECHNSNPQNKKLHYHLIEQNSLLLLIKKYLYRGRDVKVNQYGIQQKEIPIVGGQITIINSMPAIKQDFQSHYSFLQHINSFLAEPFEVKVQRKIRKATEFNYGFLQSQLGKIVRITTNSTYSSLRNFDQFKKEFITEARKCKIMIRQLRKAINNSIKQKLELLFLKNQFLGYQMKLVGSCIKSDHFKDFYKAKSYLLLEREVAIKTQQIRDEIKLKVKDLDQCIIKFYLSKKKQIYNQQKCQQVQDKKKFNAIDNLQNTGINTHNFMLGKTLAAFSREPKFKPIANVQNANTNQLQLIKAITNCLTMHMYTLWDNFILFDSRTAAHALQCQDKILVQESQFCQVIDQFIESLSEIKQTQILYEQQNNIYNNNQVALYRSLNFFGIIAPQKDVKGYQIGKRIAIKPDQNHIKSSFLKKAECQKTKLPLIKPIMIKTEMKISQLLLQPIQSMKNQQREIQELNSSG